MISRSSVDDPQVTSPQVAEFEGFELDARLGELRRKGERVKLQDQPFQLLLLLVRRAGDIVTRDEIRQELWPNEFVDFDHSLNAAIRKLRAALDDSAEEPRFIETVARRGYRFMPTVHWAPSKRASFKLPIAAVAALLIAIALGGFAMLRQKPAHPRVDAIAVLPFTIDDPRNEHLSDGLTEMLIDSISRLPNLRVMARTTVFRYKATSDPEQVARDLNVGAIVVGRIRRERDQYAIRVELIDTRDSTQIWGNEFNARDAELPVVQQQIADDLSVQLRRRDQRLVRSTKNPEAYELYLKGLYAWNKRGRENLDRALVYFNQAADADPTFASAYAGMANVYGVMVGAGYIPVSEGVSKVLASARHALDIDPDNAEALTSIATTKFRNLYDFEGAERDYRHAIASNPNYPTVHQWYADFLRSMNRFPEARRESDAAYKLDPLSGPIANARCFGFFAEHRFDEALAFIRKSSMDLSYCEIAVLMAKGETADAVKRIEALESIPSELRVATADGYRKDGQRGVWRAQIDFMLHDPNAKLTLPIDIAARYAALGEKDEAFRWLEIAYANRISRLTAINYDPPFESLRSDPRFDDLLRRIGLPKIPLRPAVVG